MDIEKLKKQLIRHEARKLDVYKCSAGKLTVGIGHNLTDNGISGAVCRLMFQEDISRCSRELETIFGHSFSLYPENIQLVLADMIFNLGFVRFNWFKKMIQAVRDRNWSEMSAQMEDSKWFNQVGERAVNLIKMVNDVNELDGRQDKAT